MKKKFRILSIISLCSSLLLLSCTKQSGLCESASSNTDASCKISADLGINASLLEINFQPVSFFDKSSNSLITIPATQFSAGKVESTIFLYSDSVAMTVDNAISAIQSASLSPSSNSTNSVPYVKIEAKAGVNYRFRYTKYNSSNVKTYEKDGYAIVQNGYAYIPLVNMLFDNQLVTQGATVGTQSKNVISIIAISGSKEGLAKQVSITTSVNIQGGDFKLTYLQDILDFKIEKRWFSYRKNIDFSDVNDAFGFVKLQDQNQAGETSPLKVRIVFKDDFKMQIDQELFEEMPFQFEKYKQTGDVTVNRGYSFYANDVSLDTISDIKHRIFLGGVEMRKDSGKVYTIDSYGPNIPFDISFKFNFNKSDLYKSGQASSQDPNNHGLHYPLKPQCFLEKPSLTFQPWVLENTKMQEEQKGNTVTICNIDTNSYQLIPAANPNGLSLIDTWFGAFNYAPSRPEKNELGNLYGVRHVKFKASGCFKIQVRPLSSSSESDWIDKTKGNTNCGDQNSDASWVYFDAEKVFTIFDNAQQYQTQVGLKAILDVFSTSAPISKSDLTVNGEKLSGNAIRHLY